MAGRETRKACAAAALLLLSASIGAFAQEAPRAAVDSDPGWRVALESASQLDDASRTIVVSGTSDAHCAPQFTRIARNDKGLAIHLAAATTGCDAARRAAFAVRIDFDALTGERLPPVVQPTWVYLDSAGDSRLVAFGVLDPTARETAPRPDNGFWWATSGDRETSLAGSGVSLESQGDRLAAGLLSFNELGDSTWLFGSAPLIGRVAKIPLVQLVRGDSPFNPSGNRPLAEPGPRLELALDGPTHAQAWLVRQRGDREVEVRELVLARSAFAANPPGGAWRGRWVLVRDGESNARVLDLQDFSMADAETFRLFDAGAGVSLDCRMTAGTPVQQADFCMLSSAAQDIASFDQVGLDRLAGQDEAGARVQLLRVR